jgi:hypothetical protein
MLCPNCHSDDVITVQDQLICVNCGRLLTAAEAAAQKAKVKVKTSDKRKPGRPRAAKLDTPHATAVKAAAAKAVPDSTFLVDDIRPAKPAASTVSAQKKPSKITHHSVVASSLRALHPSWIVLAIPGAVLVAEAIIMIVRAYLYIPRAEQWHQLLIGLCLSLSGVIWLRFVRSAVMYHRAGVHDHRLAGMGTALRAVTARTGRFCVFGLRHSAAALVELSLLALVVWYGGSVASLPNLVLIGLIFVACFGLLYLLGSLWVVQRLVEAGIIVSDLDLAEAHRLGWRLWRKHWELLGARLAALFVIVTLGGAVAIAVRMALLHRSAVVQLVVIVAVTTLTIALLTVASGGAAEASYRQLVNLSEPSRAHQLLGRRRALKPTAWATILLGCGLVLPLAAASAGLVLWH